MPVALAKSHFCERFDPRRLAAFQSLEFKARYVMEGFLAGIHQSPFHGISVEFSDYRNYQPGDDLRHLDWRLYARSDRLCIKRYMQETNARFYIVCDTSSSMAYRGSGAWGSKIECARILAAALAWLLLKQNDAAGLVALTGPESVPRLIRPSQRATQFGLILRHLEGLQAAGGAALAQLLQHTARLVHRRGVILFFSDLLEPSEEIADGFKQLRFHGHDCMIFHVMDKDEVEFPFTNQQTFEDLETGERRRVDPQAIRQRYLSRLDTFLQAHRQLFASLEMPYCQVRTDQDPWSALALFLAERKRLK